MPSSAANPARGRDVNRQFRPVSRIDAKAADNEVALRHGVNLPVGTIKWSHNQRTAAKRLGLTQRGYGDVKTLPRLRERWQFGRNHDRSGVFQGGVDTCRQVHAKA